MKLTNKLFFFTIILFVLSSCVAKKTVTEFKEKIVKDSIFITKDRYITKQVNDTILINSVCDTLGNLKDFDRQIHSGGVKVKLRSFNGGIEATVNIDSLVNERINTFKQNYTQEVSIKTQKVVIYKTPLWAWIYITASALIIFLLLKTRNR